MVTNSTGIPEHRSGSIKSRILVVDREPFVGFGIIEKIKLKEAEIVFINKLFSATKELLYTKYDLIFLGDKFKGGDTYEVGLAIKHYGQNLSTPVICIKGSERRTLKLFRLLKPYSTIIDSDKVDVDKLRSYFSRSQLVGVN